VGRQLKREATWPILGLVTASVLGAAISLVAIPGAWPVIVAMASLQLGATACGILAPRRPVLWTAVIAVGSLASTVPDPRLSELAYSGATPWIGLAAAMAAMNLYRHASDWIAIGAGTTALALGLSGVVAASLRAGIPVATAVLAASVPFLIGVLMASTLHLRDAREDRLRGPERSIDFGDLADGGSLAQGTLETARRALAIVALRSDELAGSATDDATRHTAVDLRDVATRGLNGTSANGNAVTHIEVRTSIVAGASEPPDPRTSAGPMPKLSDREREILRMVATGASNAAIGRSLYLSEATVKQYVSRLMRRFDRENRTQLALMAANWFPVSDTDRDDADEHLPPR
jgi:DNA-binding CsgD family transcriptional regulator